MEIKSLLHTGLSIVILSSIPTITGYANMAKTFKDLSPHALANRQVEIPKTELLADLKTLPDNGLSPAGKTIKSILFINRVTVLLIDINTVCKTPGPLGSKERHKDTCCICKYIADDMAETFKDLRTRECNELARQAIRLSFHGAATWSKTLGGGDPSSSPTNGDARKT